MLKTDEEPEDPQRRASAETGQNGIPVWEGCHEEGGWRMGGLIGGPGRTGDVGTVEEKTSGSFWHSTESLPGTLLSTYNMLPL